MSLSVTPSDLSLADAVIYGEARQASLGRGADWSMVTTDEDEAFVAISVDTYLHETLHFDGQIYLPGPARDTFLPREILSDNLLDRMED